MKLILVIFAATLVTMTVRAEGETTAQGADPQHKDHSHKHGKKCGHKSLKHGDHTDFVHDGHKHKAHGDHYDDCGSEAPGTAPAAESKEEAKSS